MTLFVFPEEGRETNAAQYSYVMRRTGQSGVVGTPGDNRLRVITQGDGLKAHIQPGLAFIRGFIFDNDEDYIANFETASSSNPRIDTVVLRLYQSSIEDKPQGEVVVIKGVPSVNPVPLPIVREDVEEYDIPLAYVKIGQSATTIVADDIQDVRQYIGVWKDVSGRPVNPTAGTVGYNQSTNNVEIYTGLFWTFFGANFTQGESQGSVELSGGLIVKWGIFNVTGYINTDPIIWGTEQITSFDTPFPNQNLMTICNSGNFIQPDERAGSGQSASTGYMYLDKFSFHSQFSSTDPDMGDCILQHKFIAIGR